MADSEEARIALMIGPVSAAGSGPLYQQIVDGVRREVSEGNLKPGTSLPSFRALASELMVSLITVKRAYEELERDGIIFRRQGLGTFIAEEGDSASREAKRKTARKLFEQAVREAGEAGMTESEILSLLQKVIEQEKNE